MEFEMNRRGLRDEVEEKKNKGREGSRRNRQDEVMGKAANFIGKAIHRATQRTVRFIRWLQSGPLSPRLPERSHSNAQTGLVPQKIINFSPPIPGT